MCPQTGRTPVYNSVSAIGPLAATFKYTLPGDVGEHYFGASDARMNLTWSMDSDTFEFGSMLCELEQFPQPHQPLGLA